MNVPAVLFLASDLGPCGAARQLALLAPQVAAAGVRAAVAALGPSDTPFGDELRAAGVPVLATPMRPGFDPGGWKKVRTAALGFAPTVVHAWGPAAVRAGRGLCGRGGPALVVSAAADPEGGWRGWFTARALRRSDRVVAASWAEAERYRRLGVCGDDLTRIPPGVAPAPPAPDRAAFLREVGFPPHARLILTAGRVEPGHGLKAAVCAFDVLRYDQPDLHLIVAAAGSDRAGLEEFARTLAFDDLRVRFVGVRADLPAVAGLAEVVWVPQARGGVNRALEAMAAGRPVVAWGNPDLAEVIDDGETGLLVAVGENAQLAARTHGLLTDPATAARLGASGKARAADRFPADRMAAPFARVYHELSRR